MARDDPGIRAVIRHLGQAESSLRAAAHSACLKGTRDGDTVRAALERVTEAQRALADSAVPQPTMPLSLSAREQHRMVMRRMARLVP